MSEAEFLFSGPGNRVDPPFLGAWHGTVVQRLMRGLYTSRVDARHHRLDAPAQRPATAGQRSYDPNGAAWIGMIKRNAQGLPIHSRLRTECFGDKYW